MLNTAHEKQVPSPWHSWELHCSYFQVRSETSYFSGDGELRVALCQIHSGATCIKRFPVSSRLPPHSPPPAFLHLLHQLYHSKQGFLVTKSSSCSLIMKNSCGRHVQNKALHIPGGTASLPPKPPDFIFTTENSKHNHFSSSKL